MLAEFAAKFYPTALVKMRVSLGRIPPELITPGMSELDIALAGRFRRWADMVIITNDSLIVVEGMMMANPGKLSQLELYLSLIPFTPELLPYRSLPLQGMLVYVVEDPMLVKMAREKGFRAIQFIPSFWEEWKAAVPPRWSHPKRWELD